LAAGTAATDVQATSNDVVVARAAWSVSLAVDTTTFAAGEHVTLTAVPNQNVVASPAYVLFVVDVTTGAYLGYCGRDNYNYSSVWSAGSCTVTTSFSTGPAHTYRAYIAQNYSLAAGPSAMQATSNDVVVARAAWSVSLAVDTTTFAAGEHVTLTAVPNQNVAASPAYLLFVVDVTTGAYLGYCGRDNYNYNSVWSAGTCTVKSTVWSGPAHTYRAYVAQNYLLGTGELVDVQATSNGFSAPNEGGPTLTSEVAGGANPSEPCSQRCHGDPVNSVTGEFWETAGDLTVAGVGPALSWTRSFATTRASTDGPLGHGWSDAYSLQLTPMGGTSLATSPWVQVAQENGSLVTFTADGAGGFTAPFRVFATLERLADGSYRFTRQGRQIYTFDAAGRLTGLADINGNAATLTYDGAHLVRVENSRGQDLEVSWSGDRVVSVRDQAGRQVTYAYSLAGDLTNVTLPDGSTNAYAYDPSHRVVAMTNSAGGAAANVYDSASRVTKQTDPLGRVTSFAYAAGQTTITEPDGSVTVENFSDGQVTSETKGAGTPIAQTATFTYGATNQVVSTTDALGRVTRFTYDARGNRTSVTDPLGRTATSTYDGFNNPTSVTNAAGETTTMTYDNRGNLLTTTAPDGATTTFTVNADGTVASAMDAAGRTTSFTYDANGFAATATGPDGAVVSTRYDSLGNLVSSTDPRGSAPGADAGAFTTTFTYDAAGRRLTGTDPLGAVVTTVYNAAGRPAKATDASGASTTSEYDAAGQLVAVTDAAGHRTTMTYDGGGRPLTLTDATGSVTSTSYDALGRATAVTDALGGVTRTEYDAGNRVIARVQPSGARTAYTYDAADQVVTVTDPLGKATTTTYDLAGRPVTVTDADGRAATSTYNRAGRPVSVKRADGSVLTWAYDVTGQLTAYTDASGAKTTYTYDAAGRQATSTDAAGRTTSFAYDPAGELLAVTAPDGGVTTYSYDAVGRKVGTDYSDATPDVSATYDAVGRATSVTDGTGTTAYTYDVLGRVLKVARGDSTVGYAWDDVNRLTALTYPNGQTVTDSYDATGQLTKVTDWQGRDYTYAWTPDGQVNTVNYPNGVTTAYNHDASGQVLGVATQNNAGTALLNLAYSYTDAGSLASQTTDRTAEPRAPPSVGASTSTFTWDPLGRIAAVTGEGAGTFAFDAAGSLTSTGDGRTLTYNSAGQLTAMTTPAAGTDPTGSTTSFTYDARGNRATATTDTGPTAGTATYTDNLANQLTTLTGPTGSASSYTYDGNGLRTTATTGTGDQAVTEHYTWDTTSTVPRLLTDATHAYIYGTGSTPLAQVSLTGGHTDYLHTDLIGSVRTTTNDTGQVTSDADYDTYGLAQNLGGAPSFTITRFGYAGQYTDPTGLIYLRARYYDPTTAQFLTRDPLIDQTHNPYGYTAGNPLQFTDPLGLDWLQNWSDFSAAFGDAVTFGGTKQIRILMGVDDVVNTCAAAYTWGGATGIVAMTALDGAGILEAGARTITAGRLLETGGEAAETATGAVRPYEVGTFNELRARSVVGDELDLHHVPQTQPAGQVIPGYARGNAPAIALPAEEHGLIPNLKGVFSGSADDLVGLDIANLRDYTGAPESSIQQLRDLIGRSYPDSLGGR
jgi:RHS repeat-associated protein